MYDNKKFEIEEKVIELNELVDDSNITLTEKEDIKNVLKNAESIINGRYDSMDYVIQENQIDQCLNSLNNMIKRLKIRKK